MSDVTEILSAIERGDAAASDQLLPLVYNELRDLAAAKLAQEKPGQTLQATALVHEAYLKLVDTDLPLQWDSRGHFFAAAADAMRRILVDNARRKRSQKRGGTRIRQLLNEEDVEAPEVDQDVLALDEALAKLGEVDQKVADLVKLRYFAGLTNKDAAHVIGVSARTADKYWAYAKAWLLKEMENDE